MSDASATPPTDASAESDALAEGVSPEPQPEGFAPATPLLRIITPGATDEEIAALVSVFASLGEVEPASKPPASEWSAPHRKLRAAYPHWRSSGMP